MAALRRRWRGPSWRMLALIASLLILGFGGLLLAGLLGARQGLELRRAQRATAVAEHFQRGLRYLGSGQRTLAKAEFARVLELEPDHQAALVHLRQLEEEGMSVGSPTATPLPTPTRPSTPTPSPSTPQTSALDGLLADARQLLEQQRWEEAALRLEQLRAIAPNYQPQTVTDLLFRAYYRRGLQLVQGNHLEAALRSFDRALALRPDDVEAREQRDLAALYVAGIGTWGADWKRTIATFTELYERRPDYRDARQRLFDAYREYGEALAHKERWCAAAEQYAGALRVRDDPEVARLQEEAEYLCRTATPTPTPTPSVEPTATVAVTPTLIIEITPLPTRPFVGEGHIAFGYFNQERGQEEVWLLPVAGGEPRLLVERASQPALSPDGTYVAFRSHRSDMAGLAIMPVAGGEWRRLTSYVEDSVPAWSPDGRRLAFASNREGDRKWRIYHVWADGHSPATKLTFGRAPAWSPDGTRIVYQGCDVQGRCGLRIMNPDEGSSQPLTDVPGDTAPAWSPDGRRLAFASYERSGNWELYLLDLASGEITPLAPHPANDGLPAWSPDGRRLAFLSDRDGLWAIFVLDLSEEEAAPVRLVDIPGDYDDWLSAQISWGP